MKLSEMLGKMKGKLPEGGASALDRQVSASPEKPGVAQNIAKDSGVSASEVKPEEVFTANSSDLKLSIRKTEMQEALDHLARLSGADNFTDAMEVVWFKADAKDKSTVASLSMLTTIYRCSLDGAVKPRIDLEDSYRESRNRVAGLNVQGPKPG